MDHKYFGSTERSDRLAEDANIAGILERALRPLAKSVGLDEAALSQAVDRDITRRVASSAFDQLEREGIRVGASRVLDLGAGLGHASVEATMRGCELFAIEPGFEWCNIVVRRLKAAGSGIAIVADGERLPFSEDVFDLEISIGVLEHVQHPDTYLQEAYRVLKPGGFLFLSCENYLSFWEPHYQLAWLPMFPKRLASIYLALRGRSSAFLMSSITYTTRQGVNRRLRATGFHFKRESTLRAMLKSRLQHYFGDNSFQKGLGAFAISSIARLIFEVENVRKIFSPHFVTIVRKPSPKNLTRR